MGSSIASFLRASVRCSEVYGPEYLLEIRFPSVHDGTFLIHVKGVPYALYMAILPTLDPGDQFERVQPSPSPSPNPVSTRNIERRAE